MRPDHSYALLSPSEIALIWRFDREFTLPVGSPDRVARLSAARRLSRATFREWKSAPEYQPASARGAA